eukprot:gene24483-32934_t
MAATMRCHYEVLQLEDRNCSIEDIKKQYKRLALVFHPDRNHGNEEEAAIKFKELSAAYSVLSDSQERKWYDDHRDSILRGGDGTADEEGSQEVNLWKFFNSSCFSGQEDGPTGFYTVYSAVFADLKEKELNAANTSATKTSKHGDSFDKYPPFGDSSTAAKEVTSFYSNWENFVSNLSFAWSDKYNLNDAPNRQTRRLMEKENIKLREVDKKAFIAQVRSLVGFVRKRDKRMIAIELESTRRRIAEEDAKRAMKEAELERRKALREKKALVIDEEQQKLDDAQREDERKKAFLLADNDSSDSDNDNHDASRGKSWYTSMEGGGADSDQEAALQRKLQELQSNNAANNGKKKKKKKSTMPTNIVGKVSAVAESSSQSASLQGDSTETVFTKSEHAGVAASNTATNTEPCNQPENSELNIKSSYIDQVDSKVTNSGCNKIIDGRGDNEEANDEEEVDSEDDESDSEVVNLFSCEVCKKHFKTDAQLNQHLSSKVHRKAVQDLAKKQKKTPNNKTKS